MIDRAAPEELTLTGDHVRLVPLSPLHAPQLAEAAAEDPSLYRWSPVPQGSDAFLRYVETALSWRDEGTAVPFAIERMNDGRIIGSTRFWNIERWAWPADHPRSNARSIDGCEIGYTWFSRSAVRTAANTETKLLLVKHAFTVWDAFRVCFHADARNGRSRRALERLGARYEGLLRAHRLAVDGIPRDSARYSFTRDDWPAARARLKERLTRHSERVTD